MSARRTLWHRLTGLLPPEERPFTPAVEGDERPARLDPEYERDRRQIERAAAEYARQRLLGLLPPDPDQIEDYPRRPRTSVPSRPDDAPPSWDNVVRAYEENR